MSEKKVYECNPDVIDMDKIVNIEDMMYKSGLSVEFLRKTYGDNFTFVDEEDAKWIGKFRDAQNPRLSEFNALVELIDTCPANFEGKLFETLRHYRVNLYQFWVYHSRCPKRMRKAAMADWLTFCRRKLELIKNREIYIGDLSQSEYLPKSFLKEFAKALVETGYFNV
ncbi:hypothetical protein HNV12_01950 [Methanococcoides sp. SA1]|nr:hypothetical protein [Methanococcoides sp. SA1]